MGSWMDSLNDAQREAAMHGDGPLLIVAGAGTGKTMTLACRVAHLFERGVSPERILLLTFTRRAAAEMVRRAEEMSGSRSSGRVWGGTFHATANRLLRIYGPAVGLPADFTVLDQSDAADLMNLIREERGLGKGEKRFPRKQTLVSIYSRSVAAREKLADVLQKQYPWCAEFFDPIKAIFEVYTSRKRSQNVLDYDDLLLFWHVLVSASPAAAAIRERFDHVLVDEYQDTNAVQADILRALRFDNPNLTVVGDDAQAIYAFRAATIRNILDFPEHFPGTTIVKLEQNYRSTQPILAASNAVMAEAKQRYTKELWSQRSSDQQPVLVHCADEHAQCTNVCDRIVAHLEEGIPLHRQGVLFRAGHHSDMLEVELARRNIPFHKYGGLKFIESAHIKDMLALLRILENPKDEMSWFRVLLLLDGVGPRIARRLIDALLAPAIAASPWRVLAEDPPAPPPAARASFAALREVLLDCSAVVFEDDDEGEARARSSGPTVAVQVERARQFYEPVFARTYDKAVMRLRDLEELEQIATGYRSRRRFLADLTLDPPASTSDLAQPPFLEEDFLILSTIHSAKGCEWDVVHVLHAADGMIPSDMAVGDEAGVEEERRLFYVALTRAKDWLYVYFPLRYYHKKHALGDNHSFAQLSRFITSEVRACFTEEAQAVAEDAAGKWTGKGDASSVDDFLRGLWGE